MPKQVPEVVYPEPVTYTDTYWLHVRTPAGALTSVPGDETDLRTLKAVAEELGNTTALVLVHSAT